MKAIHGVGSSAVLVELDNGDYGVGLIYNGDSFVGETFETLAKAVEVYRAKVHAANGYFKKFGTKSE